MRSVSKLMRSVAAPKKLWSWFEKHEVGRSRNRGGRYQLLRLVVWKYYGCTWCTGSGSGVSRSLLTCCSAFRVGMACYASRVYFLASWLVRGLWLWWSLWPLQACVWVCVRLSVCLSVCLFARYQLVPFMYRLTPRAIRDIYRGG